MWVALENPTVYVGALENPTVYMDALENPTAYVGALKNPTLYVGALENPTLYVLALESPTVYVGVFEFMRVLHVNRRGPQYGCGVVHITRGTTHHHIKGPTPHTVAPPSTNGGLYYAKESLNHIEKVLHKTIGSRQTLGLNPTFKGPIHCTLRPRHHT